MSLRKIPTFNNTLLFRLTILYGVIFTITSLVAFSVFYYSVHTVTMERMDLGLLEEIGEYSTEMAEKGLEGVKSSIAEEAESEDPSEEFYRLVNFNGDILTTTDMASWGPVDKNDILAKLQVKKTNYIFQTIPVPGQSYKARIISAIIGSEVILQFGETLEDAQKYLNIFRKLFLLLIIIIIFLSIIIGWFLARRAIFDMEEVTLTAEEISNGAYDQRVQIKDQFEEIKRLGTTFNKMVDRIQGLLKSMKEINDNIAHDLRSPLARIRGIAEMTLLNKKSIHDFKDMAVSTMEECDSLIDMINTMLDITEAEAGVIKVKDEEFNLVELIVGACELFRPMADEKKIKLKINNPETLTFRGDRKKMQRIVTNLLENAIKYTPEKGDVAVSAVSQDKEVQIVIEDTGMGISETDLPHVFERFYQCDRSRSKGGVGLGLSLVKAYTESINGTISVNSAINQGSIFTLRFVQ